MSRFFGRLGLGFLISFLVTAIFAGGVQNALFLLLVSIVCTAGIGLVLWIPVWWFVGAFTLYVWFKSFRGKPALKLEPVPNATELRKVEHLALKAYVDKAMANGMSPDEMTRRLQDNGWQKADIERAYQSFVSHRSTTQEA